ncbi:unnamed protein product [[Candida] boidinii]|nr:unnamed protein product [[Candida] boidinii]
MAKPALTASELGWGRPKISDSEGAVCNGDEAGEEDANAAADATAAVGGGGGGGGSGGRAGDAGESFALLKPMMLIFVLV